MSRTGQKTPAWKPAVEFDRCYLFVCNDQVSRVFLSTELYWLMGRPKAVNWYAVEGGVALSVPYRPDANSLPVKVGSGSQPHFTSRELGRIIGLGGKLFYDYDERTRGPGGKFGPRVFYFRKK